MLQQLRLSNSANKYTLQKATILRMKINSFFSEEYNIKG